MGDVGRLCARLVVFALVLALLPVVSASAVTTPTTTFIVDTTEDTTGTCAIDPTDCTLRQAINTVDANGGANTIQFNVPAGSTISLTNGSLLVNPASGTTLTITPGTGRATPRPRRSRTR
jgi:CSLREA domain-containing protein